MRPYLIDVDEVLIDWNTPFAKWMETKGYGKRDKDFTGYSLSGYWPHVASGVIRKEMDHFHHSDQYLNLLPFPDCESALHAIKAAYAASLLIAVSCCGTSPWVKQARAHQLRKLPFDSVLCLPYDSSKFVIYKQFSPGVVIDDNMPHLLSGMDAGHRAFAFDRPWNREFPGRRIFTWTDVGSLL